MINIEAQNDFWFWLNERHRVYLKKETGEPKPWTEDYALQHFKFCNVFRDLDKQSKWLNSNVLSHKLIDDLAIFNVYAFRAFNWYPTYQVLSKPYSFITYWTGEQAYSRLLEIAKTKLTSGAYMLRGRQGMPKYESIIRTLTNIWFEKGIVARELSEHNTLENAYKVLMGHHFWGWGPFTTYQVLLDLLNTPVCAGAEDVNSWCVFGPGAKRGLREIWPELKLQDAWMLEAARGLLADQVKYREPHVPELNLQDIEFSLCELQKYRRIKAGGRGKSKYAGT